MPDPSEIALRWPSWLRIALVGCVVLIVSGAGLFAYRYYTLPSTLTVAAGSFDGEAVRLMSAIAGRLTQAASPVRLKIVDTGTSLDASKAFASGTVDLAIVRADIGDLPAARTVVVLTYGVLMIIVPPGSPIEDMGGLAGKTVGVMNGELNHRVVEVLTREYDLASARVRFRDVTRAEAQKGFETRQLHALLTVVPMSEKYLAAVRSLFPVNAKKQPGLIAIESAAAIANVAHAYESYDLPKGTLRGAPPIPDDDLTTLRIPYYLVANRKLDDDSVTTLTKAVMDARRELVGQFPLLAQIAAPSTDTDAFIPVHPGAAAFFDGTQQDFFDRYSNALYYGPMMLGALASGLVALWKFLGVGAGGRTGSPLDPMYALAARIRSAQSDDDLAAIEEEIDNIIKAELKKYAKGESQAMDAAALSLAAQRLEYLINYRRQRLEAGAPSIATT